MSTDKPHQAARTTIVGGQPPGNARDLPPVPAGLEHLIHLAAASPEFADALCRHRHRAAQASGVELTPHEQAMLDAVPEASLEQMIRRVDARLAPPRRREFLESAAAAVALLVGGTALAGCGDKKKPAQTRISPTREADPAPPGSMGARMDRPPAMPSSPAGIRPDPVRPTLDAPADAEVPQPRARPKKHPVSRGIRPGRRRRRKKPPASMGIRPEPRPERSIMTFGHSATDDLDDL